MDKLDKFLPDFDDILKLIEKIKSVRMQKVLTDLEIKNEVANVYKVTVADERFFVSGKPPSAVYVKNTWEHTGLQNEISKMRDNYARCSVELAYLENKLSVYRDMIDVWRTLSANERTNIV